MLICADLNLSWIEGCDPLCSRSLASTHSPSAALVSVNSVPRIIWVSLVVAMIAASTSHIATVAVATFFATNVDDFVVLILFFGRVWAPRFGAAKDHTEQGPQGPVWVFVVLGANAPLLLVEPPPRTVPKRCLQVWDSCCEIRPGGNC